MSPISSDPHKRRVPEEAPGPGLQTPNQVTNGRKPVSALSGSDGAKEQPPSPKAVEVMGKVGAFYALQLRDYRLFWTANFFGSAGMWIQQATLGWLVYDLTGSGTLLGAINGVRTIPMILLAPLAGVAADRVNRRQLMLATQITVVLVTLVLALGFFTDRVEIWHLFLFTLIGGTIQVMNMPVQQTVVFDLVPRHVLPNAVAIGSMAFNVTRVFGPSVAGYLIAWLGPGGNFLVQSAAYVGATISIAMIAFPPRKTTPDGNSIVRNIADGFRYVVNDPSAKVLLMMAIIPPLLIIPSMMALAPLFAKDVFKSGPTGLGLLMSASGLGGLLGALFVASLGRFERRGLLQLVTLFLAGVALLLFTFTRSLGPALPLLLVAGLCEMVYMTTNQTILQLSVPDHMRGRVTSLFMLSMSLMPLSALLLGSASDLLGGPTVVRIASALAIVAAVLVFLFVPRVRNLRLSQVQFSGMSANEQTGKRTR